MKTIREYFDYLFKLERTRMKYDLTNIKFMLKQLGNPHNNFQSIHIAGTNGKGSTASFISSILMEHGLKVGLVTSPHILKFNERIRVNSKCLSDKFIIDFLKSNETVIKKIKPSFFEVNTAMAFEYFSRNKVDIAVVECGLGGRLDSTNVLYSALSVITQIGMDHMQYLGKTLRKIAFEKIGIVKPGVDVIVSDNHKSLKNIFNNGVQKENLFYLDNECKITILSSGINGIKFKYEQKQGNESVYSTPLPGIFQITNAAAAILTSTKYLLNNGIKPQYRKIQNGLSRIKENSGLRCRLETINHHGIEYIFDISHNTDGIKETVKTLKHDKPHITIFGIMEDKNVIGALKEVLKISNIIILTKPDYKRAAEPDYLYNTAKKYGTKKELYISNNVPEAVKLANKIDKKNKRVFITGSFFLVG